MEKENITTCNAGSTIQRVKVPLKEVKSNLAYQQSRCSCNRSAQKEGERQKGSSGRREGRGRRKGAEETEDKEGEEGERKGGGGGGENEEEGEEEGRRT